MAPCPEAGDRQTQSPGTLASILAQGVMALPGFARGSGPVPEAVGAWSHDPDGLTPAERTAAASLYAALMTATCLDRLAADGPIFVEGPFARNGLYGAALARLTGRAVHPSSHRTGTSGGAARLFASGGADAARHPELSENGPPLGEAFDGYAARWWHEAALRAR